MEQYSSWVEELYGQGHNYNFEFVSSTSELDVRTAEPHTSPLALFLLALIHAEKGKSSIALKHLKELKQESEKSENKDCKDGYVYLIAGLERLVSEQQGNAAPCSVNTPFANLSDKGKAFVYACKAYAMSRWDPEVLCETMIRSSEEACKLDPDKVCYRLSYAMLLGRRRRQRRISNSITEQESFAGIKKERKFLDSCLLTGTPDDIIMTKCSLASLNCDHIYLLTCQSPRKSESIKQLQRETVKILDVLCEKLKDRSVRYNFFSIAKKVAMSYDKCARFEQHRKHCSPKAEEMFKLAISFAKENSTSTNISAYGQVSLEYGKCLMRKKRYESAREVLREAWERSRIGECFINYIRCCKESIEMYNPLNDIEDGLRNLLHSYSDVRCKVALLCLRADYLIQTSERVEAAVGSLMDALRVDPGGKYMRNVNQNWGIWRRHIDKEQDFHEAKQSRCNFVDFIDKLECLIDLQIETVREDNKAKIHYLRAKAEYFSTKRPQEAKKASVVLQEALSAARITGDQNTISAILSQTSALNLPRKPGQDITELSSVLSDLKLSSKD